jgi:hypothetical protein
MASSSTQTPPCVLPGLPGSWWVPPSAIASAYPDLHSTILLLRMLTTHLVAMQVSLCSKTGIRMTMSRIWVSTFTSQNLWLLPSHFSIH